MNAKEGQQEEAEDQVLFNSSYQMAKELNYLPNFGLDQSIPFEHEQSQDNERTREKKITWLEVSKNVLDSPRCNLSVESNQKGSPYVPSKNILKNFNSTNDKILVKQYFIQKYFKNSQRYCKDSNQKQNYQSNSCVSNLNYKKIKQENGDFEEEQTCVKKDKMKKSDSLDRNFVYFDENSRKNLEIKQKFWKDLRQEHNNPDQENNIIVQDGYNQMNESQGKKNQTNKQSYSFQRKPNVKTQNSNQFLSNKSQVRVREVKVIDKIKVRRKSCCCKDCGGESKKMKKIISLPFKTMTQSISDINKLGINTGFKCLAFIGKVRKSKILDSNLSFNLAQQKQNLSYSQDSITLDIDSNEQGNSETPATFNGNILLEKNISKQSQGSYIKIEKGSNIRISYKAVIKNDSRNQGESFGDLRKKKRSLSVKPSNMHSQREEKNQQQQQMTQRRQLLETIQDSKHENEFHNDTDQDTHSKPIDSSEDDLKLTFKSSVEETDSFQHNKINQFSYHSSKKGFYKPASKAQQVKKIMNMIKQQNRVGGISNQAFKKTSFHSERFSQRTPKAGQSSQESHSKISNDLLQQHAYIQQHLPTQEINPYKMVEESMTAIQKQSITSQQDSQALAHLNEQKVENPESLENLHNKQQIVTNPVHSNNNNNSSNNNNNNNNNNRDYKKLNLKININNNQQLSTNELQQTRKKNSFMHSGDENIEQLNKQKSQIKDSYFVTNPYKNNSQLPKMIYLPFNTYNDTLMQQQSQSLNTAKSKKFKFQSKVPQNRILIKTEQIQSTESSFVQPHHQTNEYNKDGKLNQVGFLSSRDNYKQQKDIFRQSAFTPKTTTEKDFISRFVRKSGLQNQSFHQKNNQFQNKPLNEFEFQYSSPRLNNKSPRFIFNVFKNQNQNKNLYNSRRQDDKLSLSSNRTQFLTDSVDRAQNHIKQQHVKLPQTFSQSYQKVSLEQTLKKLKQSKLSTNEKLQNYSELFTFCNL